MVMGKALLRFLGIILLVGGIFVVCLAGKGKEDAKPNEVQFGVIVDGQIVMNDDKGYIGGNSEMEEEMESLAGLGWLFSAFGGGLLISSAVIGKKEKENHQYDY